MKFLALLLIISVLGCGNHENFAVQSQTTPLFCYQELQLVKAGKTVDGQTRMVLRIAGNKNALLTKKDGGELYFVDVTDFLHENKQKANDARHWRAFNVIVLSLGVVTLAFTMRALVDDFALATEGLLLGGGLTALGGYYSIFGGDKHWKKHQREFETLFTRGKVTVSTPKLGAMLKTLSSYTKSEETIFIPTSVQPQSCQTDG